jgi:hypothetical protein
VKKSTVAFYGIKNTSLHIIAAILWVALNLNCSQHTNAEFNSIFDGNSFDGWEGSTEYFRIEEGAIVAGTLKEEIPLNQFLCSEKNYTDFELRIKVKFTSTDNNAGIQFRSSRIPDHHEVVGYQADVGSTPSGLVWGGLYDESRRNKFLAQPAEDLIKKVLNPSDWNDYRIRCEGSHIQFWLNGQSILDYVEADDDIAGSGIICVQIHSGAPAEAWYKDIVIKELK